MTQLLVFVLAIGASWGGIRENLVDLEVKVDLALGMRLGTTGDIYLQQDDEDGIIKGIGYDLERFIGFDPKLFKKETSLEEFLKEGLSFKTPSQRHVLTLKPLVGFDKTGGPMTLSMVDRSGKNCEFKFHIVKDGPFQMYFENKDDQEYVRSILVNASRNGNLEQFNINGGLIYPL